MNLELVNKIAKAVLYEGYMLYPYRASAVKNRQRWNFGAVYPEAFSAASSGVDPCAMQTQVLLTGEGNSTIDLKIRFLHLLARDVYEALECGESVEDGGWRIENGESKRDERGARDPQSSGFGPQSSSFHRVESLEVEGQLFQSWQEAVEREVTCALVSIDALCAEPAKITFTFPQSCETETVRDSGGRVAGSVVRRQHSINGVLEVLTERVAERLFRVTARVSNVTPMDRDDLKVRDEALMRSFVSTHTILGVSNGEFVSLLDPPEALREPASQCRNIGTYPVLVGENEERDLMLSSPIILYDYPQIAPESAGDLFDSTEIDEILTLRIMTLTEQEKREMRNTDDRARRILERTETMPVEQLMKLHGAVRGLRPVNKNAE